MRVKNADEVTLIDIPKLFSTLLERIQPLESEILQAESHAASMKSRLEKQFELVKFELMGSHSRGSAIRRFSDVDYLTVFSRDDARWGSRYVDSRTLLRRVKSCLEGRYSQTAMRRDSQALVIKFGGGAYGVDIVPGFFEEMERNEFATYPLYYIPDGTGDWLPTSPATHGKFIRESDEASNSKLSRTIQLMKHWGFSRFPPIPFHPFHLELLFSAEGIFKGAKSYSMCLFDAFDLLSRRQCRPLRDPVGISGIITATITEPQRDYLYRAIVLARDRAWKAIEFEESGKVFNARGMWSTIFNGKFPAYA